MITSRPKLSYLVTKQSSEYATRALTMNDSLCAWRPTNKNETLEDTNAGRANGQSGSDGAAKRDSGDGTCRCGALHALLTYGLWPQPHSHCRLASRRGQCLFVARHPSRRISDSFWRASLIENRRVT